MLLPPTNPVAVEGEGVCYLVDISYLDPKKDINTLGGESNRDKMDVRLPLYKVFVCSFVSRIDSGIYFAY